jgi:peroxiredoxin
VAEDGRAPRTWRRAGNEMVNGTSCIKLIGEQQSEDWDKPRADRGAWRRTDTVWIAPRLGVAFRVERLIERREPAMREATHKLALRYELDSSLQYPGQLSEDRRQEILRARSFGEAAAPLLLDPGQYGTQLTSLLSRINLYVEHQPQTPYRDAILYLRRQLEAAKRGERPAVVSNETTDKPAVATIGLPAPDFIASDLTAANAGTSRLRDWVGRPVLLVFYSPASPTVEELLRFARAIHSRFNGGVTVVGLAVSEDAAAARRQRAELNLGFPVLSGNGLRISYSVETTPKMVLIDAAGVVRGTYVGWGGETSEEVVAELRKWLRHP